MIQLKKNDLSSHETVVCLSPRFDSLGKTPNSQKANSRARPFSTNDNKSQKMRAATLLGFKMKNLSTLAEVIQKNATT